eukprot:TRINITY_DN5534_c0_g1_i1.p1 TRINITY_DN5534_c0_g1~~TRINITY_DN5534_c0_g1_i1.p1  ORF type:complete len:550 (-),score=163.14 TRINITY_DN5534_c0_g1_i1:77-1690(-)
MTDSTSTQLFDDHFLPKDSDVKIPYVAYDDYLINGKIVKWEGEMDDVYSPICHQGGGPIKIGTYPMMDGATAISALDAAKASFNNGRGAWATAHPKTRIAAVEKYIRLLKEKRDEVIDLLMWEICKNTAAAASEFDRTMDYCTDTIAELKALENRDSTFKTDGGIAAHIRRAPLGTVLCVGPFNYPLNESYALLIPALIMGNSVVMKLPRTGVLLHRPTFELFQECFPAGVVNIVSGSGRATLPPLMETGKIDVFAFIGTSKAASAILKAHPNPTRLRTCLGLEAKNPAIICNDCDLDVTVAQCIKGSLSYNGQRCTALKIIFVQEDIVDEFVKKYVAAVDKLKIGLPWGEGVQITPLPESGKPKYLNELIEDALAKGAKIVNANGGKSDRTIVAPTVLYPANAEMRIYQEEQFGPLVPIATFKNLEEIYDYISSSNYGQQASIFSSDTTKISSLVDILVNQVSRVNINSTCQRGPDTYPFTGRKDSATGTLSVYDALRVFSIRSLVAAIDNKTNTNIMSKIVSDSSSNFLRMDYLF